MSATVITLCTHRKRFPPAADLCARTLPSGAAEDVADVWTGRLRTAPAHVTGTALYAGRAFREAEKAATCLNARFYVVSAGLGLISAELPVPPYGLTLSAADPDGVLGLIDGGPADWWAALTVRSPFHLGLPAEGPILAALSAPYLRLVGRAWSAQPATERARLRLFAKERPSGDAAPLASVWMPYDSRLDDPRVGCTGTQGDFAQRALRHFAERFGHGSDDPTVDASRVQDALAPFAAPNVPGRRRMDDSALIALIQREWNTVGGRSGAMLRRLRDDLGVACEQSRFKILFKRAAALQFAGNPS